MSPKIEHLVQPGSRERKNVEHVLTCGLSISCEDNESKKVFPKRFMRMREMPTMCRWRITVLPLFSFFLLVPWHYWGERWRKYVMRLTFRHALKGRRTLGGLSWRLQRSPSPFWQFISGPFNWSTSTMVHAKIFWQLVAVHVWLAHYLIPQLLGLTTINGRPAAHYASCTPSVCDESPDTSKSVCT